MSCSNEKTILFIKVCQLSIMSIKQTEIDAIHSLENFMENLLLPTETVIVAHPVPSTQQNQSQLFTVT
jgi:hypothetical protein